jgi:hypothetical protein
LTFCRPLSGAGKSDLGIRFPDVKTRIAFVVATIGTPLSGAHYGIANSRLPRGYGRIWKGLTMPITREEVVSVLGPTYETLIAELMGTGASFEELREAWAWLNGDEALMGEGRPLPGTRVAELIDLLDADEEED